MSRPRSRLLVLVLVLVLVRVRVASATRSWSKPTSTASRKGGFHVLRHTYASVILEAGESVVTLARWLGHSGPTISLDYYAHFMPEAGGKGRGAIDALLGQPAAVVTAA